MSPNSFLVPIIMRDLSLEHPLIQHKVNGDLFGSIVNDPQIELWLQSLTVTHSNLLVAFNRFLDYVNGKEINFFTIEDLRLFVECFPFRMVFKVCHRICSLRDKNQLALTCTPLRIIPDTVTLLLLLLLEALFTNQHRNKSLTQMDIL